MVVDGSSSTSTTRRRKFRGQISDNMDRSKNRVPKSQRRKKKSEKRKSQKTQSADARKGSNVAKHCVFAPFLLCRWTSIEASDCTFREFFPARARISFASRFDLVFDLVFFPGSDSPATSIPMFTQPSGTSIDSCGRSIHSVLGDSEGQMRDKWETSGRQV